MASKTVDKLKAKAKSANSAASRARRELREFRDSVEARKAIAAVEIVGGGVAAGAMHGAGIDIETEQADIPIGLLAGPALVAAGVALDSDDAACVGLGMTSFGGGRLVEDLVGRAILKRRAA